MKKAFFSFFFLISLLSFCIPVFGKNKKVKPIQSRIFYNCTFFHPKANNLQKTKILKKKFSISLSDPVPMPFLSVSQGPKVVYWYIGLKKTHLFKKTSLLVSIFTNTTKIPFLQIATSLGSPLYVSLSLKRSSLFCHPVPYLKKKQKDEKTNLKKE